MHESLLQSWPHLRRWLDENQDDAAFLEQLRRHKGLSLQDAWKQTEDPAMYACLMVREGAADAVIGGLSSYYPETIRPALQVLQVEEGRSIVSSVYLVVVRGAPLFFTDCAVNIEPTAEERKRLSQFPVGQGLFFAGQNHVHLQVVASQTETSLITTNPQEIQQMQGDISQGQGTVDLNNSAGTPGI